MSNPLWLPEIVGSVMENIQRVPDLLSCACVNSIWNVEASRKLYMGSLNNMQFRTPGIVSLNRLFVASQERFARNMGFVKHLLLSSNTPTFEDEEQPATRLVCFEKCRAMCHRQYAELLLRPQGRDLASLTIPFEIMNQDFSLVSDLLLTSTVEFLAIDNYYCEILMASSGHSQNLTSPVELFSSLKALTIYKPCRNQKIDELCRLLKACDLEFFHLEEPQGYRTRCQSSIAELLPCLRQQKNLKALTLTVPYCDAPLGSASPTSTREEHGSLWPRLKALSLRGWDRRWLEQLPKFEKLQILTLRELAPGSPNISWKVIETIAKCRHLRTIDLDSLELIDVGALLDIAHGCPLLRKFSMGRLGLKLKRERAESLVLNLLRALPHLEFLALDLKFQMNGTMLQDVAHHCPGLVVLDLPQTQLSLSLMLMAKTRSLRKLESMRFAGIYFKNPRYMMQQDKIQSIVTEWRRIFPKLQGVPCPEDIYSRYYTQGNDWDTESQIDRDQVDADEKMSLSEPELYFDDHASTYKTDWSILRTKLWGALGYDEIIHDKIQYIWQTNLEIETIGWPVVPLKAFSDPVLHSTSTNCLW